MARRRLLAWSVHAYTALGLLLAAWAAILIVQGEEGDLRRALLVLFAAAVVDSTDGWMARRVGVKEVLPGIDGRRLDDIIDFHTFASIPLLLLWRAGIPGDGLAWILLAPLLASAYGFSQTDAKTEDNYFRGFPSYWNVVALYLFLLTPPGWISALLLLGLSVLVFVPTRYLYPSKGGPWPLVNVGLGAVWALILLALLLQVAVPETLWLWLSLLYPLYYFALSWLGPQN